jgi:quinol monooxygenase YgiN
MFTFVARLKAKPGKAEELRALLAHVRDETRRQEPGVVYYDFAVSADDADDHVVIEVYRDEAAQASHMQSAWVQESLPRTMPLLDGIEIEQYTAPGLRPVAMQTSKDFV